MDSVSADRHGRKPYHHGALRSALVEASLALAREGGPERVVLREAARVAGVSHSAAYRHFADREALLTEVANRAASELAAQMLRRVNCTDDPLLRLRAVGTAYVEFALSEPGLFHTAFAAHSPDSLLTETPIVAPTTPDSPRQTTPSGDGPGADRPSEILHQVLDEVLAAGLMHPRHRPGAEIAAWSAVHGLSCLLLDGLLPRASADFALQRVLTTIEEGLLDNSDQESAE